MRAMLRLIGDTEFSFETTNAAYQTGVSPQQAYLSDNELKIHRLCG
jgi:hypothetical protein